MKRLRQLFSVLVTLVAAAPVGAGELTDTAAPGSAIVFHKFVRGAVMTPDQDLLPVTQFEISVTCPKDSACATSGQAVRLKAHWVCPGSSADPTCNAVDFSLDTTVNGTILFNPANVGNRTTDVPQPLCRKGYLIAWVVDESGKPIKFDALIGNAVIRGSQTSARAYNALPIEAAESLATGDLTDSNGDGALAFDGSEYRAITGKIFGTIRYESTEPQVKTSLTLLTLDVIANQPNETTQVDLNFYNEWEELVSTNAQFICWREVKPSRLPWGPTAAFGQKGLVESTAALQSTGPVTLVGIVETTETFTQWVTQNVPVTVCDTDQNTGQTTCLSGFSDVTVSVPGIREYAYSLSNDGTPIATTFAPAGNRTGGGTECPPGTIFDPASDTCVPD